MKRFGADGDGCYSENFEVTGGRFAWDNGWTEIW